MWNGLVVWLASINSVSQRLSHCSSYVIRFCGLIQDTIRKAYFFNRTEALLGLKLSTLTRKRGAMFVRDWRNTPNSHRNQYKADRWFSFEQRSLKRGKLTSFFQPMTSFFSDIWIRRRLFKKNLVYYEFSFLHTLFFSWISENTPLNTSHHFVSISSH